MSYRFFQNRECEYFPCHKITEGQKADFNCLFCFCPLYRIPQCGGNFTLLPNGKKDCTNCTLPHYNYDYVIDKLVKEP